MKERYKKMIPVMAAVLLIAVFSLLRVSGTYAKYRTAASGGSGARVAAFSVTQSGTLTEGIHPVLAPGETEVYDIEVTNDSEVAINYTITAASPYGILPLEYTMLDEEDAELESGDLIEANSGDARTYQLQISWPANDNGYDYAGKADLIVITLMAEQAD